MKKVLFCLLIILCVSCAKEEEARIPYWPVYLELDLDFEDNELLSSFHHKIYTSSNINPNIERPGFGGVIVFHGEDFGNGPYQAYDLSCPYEAQKNVLLTLKQGDIYAECPVCKSKYELTSMGFPTEGSVSTYRLQQYNVRKVASNVGTKLIVTN